MGFVFYHCRFLSDRIPKGSVYLARPWRDDAKAAFIQCGLDEHINPLWFHDWDKPQARESAVFAVYQLWGPGILGEHCSFARVLSTTLWNALNAFLFPNKTSKDCRGAVLFCSPYAFFFR